MPDKPTTARARARTALIEDIKDAARRQIATEGAAGLSVRAVARELSLAPSGTYRYFASRDDLLTALIMDGYAALGAAVEQAEGTCRRQDLLGRLRAVAGAVRDWAVAQPSAWALLYGTPVHGYSAPAETIAQAARPSILLAGILDDARQAGMATAVTTGIDPGLDPAMAATVPSIIDLPAELAAQGVLVWSSIYGLVSFELFGHLQGSVSEPEAFFRRSVDALAASVGIR